MEKMNTAGLTPAPIGNKNILEDFADEICVTCGEQNNKETFWKRGALYVVEYEEGSNNAVVKYIYGDKKESTALAIKEELEKRSQGTGTVCEISVEGYDVHLAFYWKEEAITPIDMESEILDIVMEYCDGVFDIPAVDAYVALKDEYGEKYGKKFVEITSLNCGCGTLMVCDSEGDMYQFADLLSNYRTEVYNTVRAEDDRVSNMYN